MDIKEKAGDLFLDFAKLIFAGVVLSSIISENINTKILYIVGVVVCFLLILIGFYLYKQSTKLKNRRK